MLPDEPIGSIVLGTYVGHLLHLLQQSEIVSPRLLHRPYELFVALIEVVQIDPLDLDGPFDANSYAVLHHEPGKLPAIN